MYEEINEYSKILIEYIYLRRIFFLYAFKKLKENYRLHYKNVNKI